MRFFYYYYIAGDGNYGAGLSCSEKACFNLYAVTSAIRKCEGLGNAVITFWHEISPEEYRNMSKMLSKKVMI